MTKSRVALLALIGGACLYGIGALAQNAFQTLPSPVSGVSNASGTVAVTNTFQSVFADVPLVAGRQGRTWCLIQSLGAPTAYIFVGAIASATTPTSFNLAAGQTFDCVRYGVTIQDQISITGTAGAAFIAVQR